MWEITHAGVGKKVDEEAEVDGELDELEQGQVLLPPEVLSVFWPKAGQEVVAIHDDVHHGVLSGNSIGLKMSTQNGPFVKLKGLPLRKDYFKNCTATIP